MIIKEEKYFHKNWLEEYQNSRSIIWRHIVRLHVNLDIYSNIIHFPFWGFLHSIDSSSINFWDFVSKAMFDSSIMIIWRLIFDSGEGKTILWFKNEVMRNFQKEKYREDFENIGKEIKSLNLTQYIETNRPKFEFIRHKFLGHLGSIDIDPKEINLDELLLSYDDLLDAKKLIVHLFNILCVGYKHEIFPSGYYDNNTKSHIQRELDNIVLTSKEIHLPEDNPRAWKQFKANLTSSQIRFYNTYRKQLGLPTL